MVTVLIPVHVVPVGEVRIAPELPTARYFAPVHVMAQRLVVVPEIWDNHATPSGELTVVPPDLRSDRPGTPDGEIFRSSPCDGPKIGCRA